MDILVFGIIYIIIGILFAYVDLNYFPNIYSKKKQLFIFITLIFYWPLYIIFLAVSFLFIVIYNKKLRK